MTKSESEELVRLTAEVGRLSGQFEMFVPMITAKMESVAKDSIEQHSKHCIEKLMRPAMSKKQIAAIIGAITLVAPALSALITRLAQSI